MEEAANTYLKEGIDCNEDGEFSEKSAGNYNRINNDAMILLSQVTGDTTYEQHVLRNLRMMLTYIEPDGSIFTWFGVWKPPASIPSAPSFIISSRRRRISISPVVIFPIQETFSIFERIIAGLTYIRGVQHENGLFDYITCNFFSAPDTAFCLKKLLPVYAPHP